MKLRTEKILHNLLFSDRSVTIQDLSTEYKVGVRTIQNDIAEINNFLENYALPQVQNMHNQGLLLDFSNSERELVCQLLRDNNQDLYFNKDIRIFHLILELTLGAKFFIYEKEEEFGISKSALDSDMRDVRKLLISYKIELKSDLKEGLILRGSERKIRTMIFDQIFEHLETTDIFEESNYLLSQYQIFLKFIPYTFISKLNSLYITFYESNEYLYKNELLIILSIWILRNNKLLLRSEYSEYSDKVSTKPFIKRIISEFNLNPNKEELEYINLVTDTLSHDVDINPVDWMEVQLFTLNLIDILQSKLGFSLGDKQRELFKKLFEHNIRLHARVKKNIQLFNPLTDDIKTDYSEVFKIIKNYFNDKLNAKGLEIKDDEVAFVVIHFLTAKSQVEKNQQRAFRAVVFCNYGLATGTFVAENLQRKFPIEIVATLNTDEIYLLEKLDYDVIFSTKTMDIEKESYLVIDPIMDEKNIQNINNYLNKNRNIKINYLENKQEQSNMILTETIDLIEKHYGTVNSEFIEEIISLFKENNISIDVEVIQPMIKDVLTEDNIQLNLNVNSWEEAIKQSAQPLLKKNVIENQYVDSMINSVKEHGPYIILGDGLALAHARPEDGVNQIGLSVATLDPSIDFGNKGVDYAEIVFCLAAVDSYSHLNIIKSLVNLLNDKKTLVNLKNSRSKEEFTKILFEK